MSSADRKMLDSLTGAESGLPRPGAITPPGMGGKFAPDGHVLDFPGNTIVCHVPPGSAAHDRLILLQQALRAAPFGRHFAFLPPSSFHMTLFEGVNMVQPGRPWPAGTSAAMGLDQVTAIMTERIATVSLPQAPRVRPNGPFIWSGLGLKVTGSDPAAETDLRDSRRALRAALMLEPDGFETYSFHISLAYLVDWLSPEMAAEVVARMKALTRDVAIDLPEIVLGPAEFCTFASMHHFEPVPPNRAGTARKTGQQA